MNTSGRSELNFSKSVKIAYLRSSDQESNIKFVEEVEKHKVLYDYRLPGYSRKDTSEKAWQEVANKVNMTASECKEKWKNLRTVFIRKMKPQSNASGREKKAYYLADAMQFCLPFVKALNYHARFLKRTNEDPPSPTVTATGSHTKKQEHREEDLDCSESFDESMEDSSDIQSSQKRPSRSEAEQSPASPDSITLPPEENSSTHAMLSYPSFVPAKRKKSLTTRDQWESAQKNVVQYFNSKKARKEVDAETKAKANERRETIKMFLLSLVPEVEELTDYQIKLFKRRVLGVIDELSTTPQPTSEFPTTSTLEFVSTPFDSKTSITAVHSFPERNDMRANFTDALDIDEYEIKVEQ